MHGHSLVLSHSPVITRCGDITRVMLCFIERIMNDIGEWTTRERLVKIRSTKRRSIRRMVPWKRHVEHANKSAFTYIAHVADRYLVVARFGRLADDGDDGRVWFPQSKSLI